MRGPILMTVEKLCVAGKDYGAMVGRAVEPGRVESSSTTFNTRSECQTQLISYSNVGGAGTVAAVGQAGAIERRLYIRWRLLVLPLIYGHSFPARFVQLVS